MFELISKGNGAFLRINSVKGNKYIVKKDAIFATSPMFEIKDLENKLQSYEGIAPGELIIAPSDYSDIQEIKLASGETLKVKEEKFLAATSNLNIEYKKDEKCFIVFGEGTLFVSANGTLYEKKLEEKEEYTVAESRVVMSDKSLVSTTIMNHELTNINSNEKIVAKFIGPGRVWMQTRNR